MKRKRGLLVIAVLLIVALVFAACGNKAPAAPDKPAADKPAATAPEDSGGGGGGELTKFGLSVWTMEWDFFQLMAKGMQDACDAAGLEWTLHDQKGDQTEMVSGCQNLINQGIDALVISPFAPPAMPPVVEAAHGKGIPVVICDIGTGDSDYDAFVYSDNYGGGVMNGEEIIKLLEAKGETGKKYAMIRPAPEHVVSQERCNGASSVLNAAGYECVSDLHGTGDTPNALQLMNDTLAANPDIVAVVCGNDMAAAGAAQAALDAGITGLVISGFDLADQGVEGLKNGTISCTVMQFPYDMGWKSVDVAIELAKGNALAFDNADLKEIYVDVKLIRPADVDGKELGDVPISVSGKTRGDINMG